LLGYGTGKDKAGSLLHRPLPNLQDWVDIDGVFQHPRGAKREGTRRRYHRAIPNPPACKGWTFRHMLPAVSTGSATGVKSCESTTSTIKRSEPGTPFCLHGVACKLCTLRGGGKQYSFQKKYSNSNIEYLRIGGRGNKGDYEIGKVRGITCDNMVEL